MMIIVSNNDQTSHKLQQNFWLLFPTHKYVFYKLKKSQEIRVAESIFSTFYYLYPFNIFDYFDGGMTSHFLAVLCTYFNRKLGAMLLLRLPVPS